MYDGNSYPAGPDDGTAAFDKLSRLCMGCHDGTVALDSYGDLTGSIFITGHKLIGTDLTNDHRVGRDAPLPKAATATSTLRPTTSSGPTASSSFVR